MDITEEVKRVFDIEIGELQKVRDSLSGEIERVVRKIHACKGKVVFSGMGKPGHIARKISATMSSLGIHSYFLHPAEGLHGDLGTLTKDDILLILSNSGETAEVCSLLPSIRMIGACVVGITSNPTSTLAKYSDYLLALPVLTEACALALAPTSSTTAELVLGDALAVVLSKLRAFDREHFALYHPSGSLGKKLATYVRDLMVTGEESAAVPLGSPLPEAINEITRKALGAVLVVGENSRLCGIITDGDIRRCLMKKTDIYQSTVDEVMTARPVCVRENALAVDALRLMENRERQISVLPVINERSEAVGIIRNHDIIRQNIFI